MRQFWAGVGTTLGGLILLGLALDLRVQKDSGEYWKEIASTVACADTTTRHVRPEGVMYIAVHRLTVVKWWEGAEEMVVERWATENESFHDVWIPADGRVVACLGGRVASTRQWEGTSPNPEVIACEGYVRAFKREALGFVANTGSFDLLMATGVDGEEDDEGNPIAAIGRILREPDQYRELYDSVALSPKAVDCLWQRSTRQLDLTQ